MERLRRRSVFNAIQQELRKYIVSNHLMPGDMLPSTGDIAQRLGVSSASVREALRALEALGIVETKQGVGTFLRAYDFSPILENLTYSLLFQRDNLRELLQVRLALEIGLIPRVIECTDEDHLDKLEAIVDHMAESETDEDQDRLFHRTLYEPLGNRLVLELLDIFWIVLENLQEQSLMWEVGPRDRSLDHRPIYEAVKARDVEAAVAAIRSHYEYSMRLYASRRPKERLLSE